jgi:DNA-binding XRE family transcriptional regulator
MRDPPRDIARHIREMRNQRGITQHELAHRLGISYQLIQRYERGEKLTLERLTDIASALDSDFDSLLKADAIDWQNDLLSVLRMIVPDLGFYTRKPQVSTTVHTEARVKAMCGLPPDAPLDFGLWHGCLHVDDVEHINFELTKCLDPHGDGIMNTEYSLIGLDGVERRIIDLSRTTFDAAQQPVRRRGFMFDITRWTRGDHRSWANKLREIAKTLAPLAMGVPGLDPELNGAISLATAAL